jgi:8-oxo-dGTP pyrophosphatase MutT (NUDIX family)
MYVGAGLILRNSKFNVILVRDARSSRWGFPKGHPEIEDKKLPINTAVRETYEETGLLPDVDYIIDGANGKRIGKRVYFSGQCVRESFDKSKQPTREISDVRWWPIDELFKNEGILNSDLRCWLRKLRLNRSPTFGPAMAPASAVSSAI